MTISIGLSFIKGNYGHIFVKPSKWYLKTIMASQAKSTNASHVHKSNHPGNRERLGSCSFNTKYFIGQTGIEESI